MTSDGTANADPQADHPICTIIAGPNGAGKTTFALGYLPTFGPSKNFVNADLIAGGLSPLDPEKAQRAASRLFLAEVHEYIRRRESFAIETTLSGHSDLRMIATIDERWLDCSNVLSVASIRRSLPPASRRTREAWRPQYSD
jgi:hypothetical protein